MRTRSGLGGLLLSAIMLGSLALASCSPSTSTSSEAPAVGTKPYGTLIIGGQFGTGQLDPLIASGATFSSISRVVFDVLVDYADDDKVVPGLAERWDIAPDGMSQTFYIRKGVKFHNGDDMTGADVKFSIERMLAPESTSQQDAATWRGAIAGIDLKDNYTVVLRMKQPQFDMLKGIEGGMGSVVPKKYIEEKGVEYFRKNLVGSGPWKVLKFDLGSRLEAEAVDDHWRNVPKFRNLTLLSVSEETTAVSMLKTGELDIALISPDSVPSLKAVGIRIISFDRGTNYYAQAFYDYDNPGKYPLGDLRVRKAAQLAINQQ
ncbi:MAG: ABC transporter substrate-binding protein, partial [Dehalococcoidia bacterium]|nr:ABC transporter substrate-binding protein [Dehalococcoidia bacterium]